MVTFSSGSLTKLSSKDQVELLDSIDQLRLQGINHYISLPQIIVCGDQSSGKSSVLEAISGIPFPVKSNLCTRFPTELVLRKAPFESVTVSIVPHESRSEAERKALSSFKEELGGFDTLPDLLDRAKTEMGITAHGRTFSKDILRIEVTNPNSPQLTLVDLPGLIHTETKNQTASDIQLIKDVVQSYMKEPRSIILAVVSAKNDIANQVVLGLARTADPKGNRTLGVITKPDTLIPGGGSEAMYLSLARNQEIKFHHGWHVLKNMDSEKGSSTLAARDHEEAEFFSSGSWTTLPRSCLGIDNLRTRLSRVLLQQISAELPSLIEEIDQKFNYCKDQLDRLGHPRASHFEQRMYLIRLSQSFQDLVKASTGGTYDRPFFAPAEEKEGYEQRIRAVVQNLNEEFAAELRRRGHYRQVVDDDSESSSSVPEGVIKISRDEYVKHIDNLMRRTRGRELPGTFHPMIVVDLFREQSRPWEGIVRRHVEKVWEAASRFVGLVADHTADPSTAKALRHFVIDPAMGKVMDEMRTKTTDLLKQHMSGHPITYNDEFAEALQKNHVSGYYNLRSLAESLEYFCEPEMRRFAAHEALDCLDAYYQVAMRRFIDDVAVEVVEEKLMSALEDILSPVFVAEMSANDVTRIAGESEETRSERERLNKQLEILQNGRDTCKRFTDVKFSGEQVSRGKDEQSKVLQLEHQLEIDNLKREGELARQKLKEAEKDLEIANMQTQAAISDLVRLQRIIETQPNPTGGGGSREHPERVVVATFLRLRSSIRDLAESPLLHLDRLPDTMKVGGDSLFRLQAWNRASPRQRQYRIMTTVFQLLFRRILRPGLRMFGVQVFLRRKGHQTISASEAHLRSLEKELEANQVDHTELNTWIGTTIEATTPLRDIPYNVEGIVQEILKSLSPVIRSSSNHSASKIREQISAICEATVRLKLAIRQAPNNHKIEVPSRDAKKWGESGCDEETRSLRTTNWLHIVDHETEPDAQQRKEQRQARGDIVCIPFGALTKLDRGADGKKTKIILEKAWVVAKGDVVRPPKRKLRRPADEEYEYYEEQEEEEEEEEEEEVELRPRKRAVGKR
ncbi:hypothetical protein VTH82DRAFT_1395 [Thermothelomyces myriococcoides]